MKIKNKQQFEMAQKVAQHAVLMGRATPWHTAMMILRKAYGI